MIKRTVCILFILFLTGCAWAPKPAKDEILKEIMTQCNIYPQKANITNFQCDRKNGKMEISFEIPSLKEPNKFKARFFYHKYRGWQFDMAKDRFDCWVEPSLFADEMEFFRISDTIWQIHCLGLALSAYIVEERATPSKGTYEILPQIDPYYGRYFLEIEPYFYFTQDGNLPLTDAWGNPFFYEMDSKSRGKVLYNFQIVSLGRDLDHAHDDIVYEHEGDGLTYWPSKLLMYSR